MQIDILTLFPSMFTNVLAESILGRAVEKGLLRIQLHQIRDYTVDKHRTTDDLPYGGGAGMVMKCEPLAAAWKAAAGTSGDTHTIYFSPQGKPLTQERLVELAQSQKRLILVCGRYEGVDERFLEAHVQEQISLGDYVLSGGELPAMVLIDGLMRLLPGALGNESSAQGESFSEGLLEYPQYTRPPEWEGRKVPDVLLSGDHAKIAAWRKAQSKARTQAKRPDLFHKLLQKAPD